MFSATSLNKYHFADIARTNGIVRIAQLFALSIAMLFSFGAARAETPPVAVPVPAPVIPAPADASPDDLLYLDLSTGGRVVIQLYPQLAPAHVERIKTLVRRGFYDGLVFHRVIEGFMAQTGDPSGTGTKGSDLPDLKAEFNDRPHLRGTVSMARTNDPDSANSQFFICFMPNYSLDKKYTDFGRVISGMQYVDAIARGEPPANPDRIIQASIASDNKAPPAPVAAAPAIATPAPDAAPASN